MATNPDLNPHKAARIAMVLWNYEYAASGKGSMSFWDSLPEGQKTTCRDILTEIQNSPDEFGGRRVVWMQLSAAISGGPQQGDQ